MANMRLTLLIMFAYLCYKIKPGTDLFSWHPVLSVAGITIFMYEGLFAVRNKSFKSEELTNNVHLVLQGLGGFSVFAGFSCAVTARNKENLAHFTSTHTMFGIVAGTMMIFQVGFGFVKRIPRLTPHNPQAVRLLHRVMGAITYFLFCVTIILGLGTDYMKERSKPLETAFLVWLPLLAFGSSFAIAINQWLQWGMLPPLQKSRKIINDVIEEVHESVVTYQKKN